MSRSRYLRNPLTVKSTMQLQIMLKHFSPWLLPILATLSSNLTNSAIAAPVTAKSADAFVNSIGVNVHLTYDSYKNKDLIKSKLQELGVRHIRDGAYQEADFLAQIKDLAKHGIKTLLIFSGNPPQQVVSTAKKLQGAIEGIEGPNESDLEFFNFSYKGQKFPEATRIYQKEIQAALKADPATKNLPVVLPSMGWGENAQKLGYVGNLGNICNLHSYVNLGQRPTADIDSYFIPHAKTMCGGSLPKWSTETGYHNATSQDLGISEQAAGKYIPRLLFENFNRNIQRSYLYELIDQGNDPNDDQGRYGLLKNDGSPKPAFTTIKNIISLLFDSSNPNFQPHSLDYTLSGDKEGVHTTLLQKTNGDFFLILWQDAVSWDNVNKKDIAVTSKNIKVRLALSANKLSVYDPSKSASATKTVSASPEITLPIPDHPVILKVVGSASQASNTNQKPQSSTLSIQETPKPKLTPSQMQVEQPPSQQELQPSEEPPSQQEPQPSKEPAIEEEELQSSEE